MNPNDSIHHPRPPAHVRSLALRPMAVALHLIVSAGLLASAGWTPTSHAQTSQAAVHQYDIPAGPLSSVLPQFAAQAGIFIGGPSELAQGRQSAGVQGSYSVQQGLDALLKGTGLEAFAQADGKYGLRPIPSTSETTLAPVTVTAAHDFTEGSGSYTARSSNAATRLNLSLRETPQSVSIITRQQMDDQGLQNISDVLQQTPGITVNRDNTEGYSFYARGFQVENFLFDGVPSLATAGGNVRDNYSLTDSAIYDRVEILKGATGLVNGAGYPSGVINMVRKRPTAAFQGHASVGVGSWNNYRAELDLSSPLTEDGRIRGRVVAAKQDSHSFIDHLKTRQDLLYGIIEADLTAATTLSLGFDVQNNKGKATTNSHLPAFYSDGTVARFSRSTNAADIWAHRDQDTRRVFATLEHDFGSGWNVKAHLGQRKYESREVISGISSTTIDAVTHSIAHGFYTGGAAQFNTDTTEKTVDVQLSGKYSLFDREHKLVLGYGAARTKAVSNRFDGDTDALISDVFNWDNNATEPAFYEWWSTFDVKARQKIGYAATVLQATDRLALILGARVTDYSWSLDSRNAIPRRTLTATEVNGKVIPYAGLTFDLDTHHTVYASYTDVFKPQAYSYDANDRQLDPLTGKSYEVGVKGSYFDGKLNASAALFQLKQDNYAINDPSGATRPGGGVAQVAIQGVTTKGLELELFGELKPGWQLSTGFTYIQPRDTDDMRVSTTQPEKTFKIATMVRLPGAWQHVSLGGNVQWQSGTYFTQTIAGAARKFEQEGYAVAGLVAGIDIARNLKLTLNVNNLFDKKYYAGIGNYNTVYWGAPRNVNANLIYRF